jgi:KDO2-lipid IV(A) lauroyltransferase
MRAVGWVIGTVAWAVVPSRRRAVMQNLSYLAPSLPPARRRLLARRTFRNLIDAAIHLFRLPSMPREELLSLIQVEGDEHVRSALALGRGLLIVTGHMGPYELGGAWMAARGCPTHAMVEDLDPATLDALAIYRRATGMGLVSMKQGIRSVFRLLDDGAIVLLVADRAIGDSRSAVEMPFAHGVRPVPTGPAIFAMTKGTPIIVGHIVKNPARRPRYLVHFDPPLLAEGSGEAERLRLTRLVTDGIAAAAQRYPDQWYVFQPEWIPHERDRA